MQEKHVFLLDKIPAQEAQMRGGKGLGHCRKLIGNVNNAPGCAIANMGVNVIPPGVSIGLHKHETDAEVYVIISGSGVYTGANGRAERVKAGDITVCYAGEEHALENDGAEPLIMAGIIAQP